MSSRQELLKLLRLQLSQVQETPVQEAPVQEAPAGGTSRRIPGLRQDLRVLLPEGGFERGTLVEWLSAEVGNGAGRLALEVARDAAREGGAIVVLDRQRWFYPVAAAEIGIDLRQLIVVLVNNTRDQIWAIDQALRCAEVAAVWGVVERIDWRAFRRLQLSAEAGRAIGLLLRPAQALQEPSWAHLRLWVEPRVGPATSPTGPASSGEPASSGGPTSSRGPAQRLWVRLLRNKGGICQPGAGVEIGRDFRPPDGASPGFPSGTRREASS